MSQIVDSVEYLTANEAAKFLQMSYVTFQKKRDVIGLQAYTLFGKNNAKYYKAEDLRKLPKVQPDNR